MHSIARHLEDLVVLWLIKITIIYNLLLCLIFRLIFFEILFDT